MGLKQLVAVAAAAVAAVDQHALDASLASDEARDALDVVKAYMDDAPRVAAELVRSAASDCLVTAELQVTHQVLAQVAPDFKKYVSREVVNRLAYEISEKAPVEFVRGGWTDYYGQGVATYRAQVYVFTRAELEQFARTAYAAGLSQ